MGNSNSNQYYSSTNVPDNPSAFEFILSERDTSTVATETDNRASNIAYISSKKAMTDKLFKSLETNMKMYMIYDNYDSKNAVILKDLKKKATNQESELKQLKEDRDKLKSVLDFDKENQEKYDKNSDILKGINVFLLLIIIGLIALIIYRIMTHPSLKISNNISIEDLEKLDANNIAQLSEDELDKLTGLISNKMNTLNVKNNSVSEVINTSNKANITQSNINNKEKFTLNDIKSNKNE